MSDGGKRRSRTPVCAAPEAVLGPVGGDDRPEPIGTGTSCRTFRKSAASTGKASPLPCAGTPATKAHPMNTEEKLSFGVFKPVDHVVISFPSAAQAATAAAALNSAGFVGQAVRRYTDRQMIEQIDHDIARASPLASIGQELNLVRAHRELAEQGYHWLVVHVGDDAQARQVAGLAQREGAERAQHYGHFIVEELIDRPGNLAQVGESPDRGLDAQTPSGSEKESADLRREGGTGPQENPPGEPPARAPL